MSSKRRLISGKIKLEAVKHTEAKNCAVGHKYGVSEKLISDWIKNTENIESMLKSNSYIGNNLLPALEEVVAAWVEETKIAV